MFDGCSIVKPSSPRASVVVAISRWQPPSAGLTEIKGTRDESTDAMWTSTFGSSAINKTSGLSGFAGTV